jgi:hypothetical protein
VLALKAWLEQQLARVSGKSPIAEAMRYGLNHWDGLTRFLDDGRIELDTNIVERSIRPIVLNRKNALFVRAPGDRDQLFRLIATRRARPWGITGCCALAASGHAAAAPPSSPMNWRRLPARASSVGGISSPSIRAVPALMTNSNLLACTTGRSAGLAPLRMRPV